MTKSRRYISRDRHNRRNSDLDRPNEREFWRRVVEGGNEDWEVEIATLRLDGELAAYAVAILDGDTYRIFDGRMSTEYQDYSPGRLVEAAALGRAISDSRFAVLDWMSGIAAEKLLVANFAEGRARFVATSGSRTTERRAGTGRPRRAWPNGTSPLSRPIRSTLHRSRPNSSRPDSWRPRPVPNPGLVGSRLTHLKPPQPRSARPHPVLCSVSHVTRG